MLANNGIFKNMQYAITEKVGNAVTLQIFHYCSILFVLVCGSF